MAHTKEVVSCLLVLLVGSRCPNPGFTIRTTLNGDFLNSQTGGSCPSGILGKGIALVKRADKLEIYSSSS